MIGSLSGVRGLKQSLKVPAACTLLELHRNLARVTGLPAEWGKREMPEKNREINQQPASVSLSIKWGQN